jgi:hypothetical protein
MATTKTTRSLAPGRMDYKINPVVILRRAVLAGAVESQLMRSYAKAFVRQFNGLDLFLIVDQNIVYTITQLADKMLVGCH